MAYKVFLKDKYDHLVSISYELPIHYHMDGQQIFPVVGELFVFKDFDKATAFYGETSFVRREIWEVETGRLIARKLGNVGGISDRQWWILPRGGKIHHGLKLPDGTYTTPWVRLIRRIR